MPLAGGVAAPVVAPIRSNKSGKPQNHIDTGTYIDLDTDTPNCAIYFTTDGCLPNPWKRIVNGKEITFRYSGPFTLKPGKRTLKAIAVHKVTKVESHIITKTFFVDDLTEMGSEDENIYELDSNNSYNSDVENKKIQKKIQSKPIDAWSEDSVDHFLQRTADQGFSATNVSGTQINLWGGNPGMGWDVRTPGNTTFTGSYAPQYPQPQIQFPQQDMAMIQQHQLNAIANQLTQQIDQNRQATVAELRNALKEIETLKAKAQPQPTESKGKFEPEILPVSPGNGDLKKQIEHVYGHLLQFARGNPEFAAGIGPAKMSKVLSADFDEGPESYLITINLGKPGFKQPLSQPKTIKKDIPPPQPSAPTKKLRIKPEDVPAGHSVEDKVRQAKGEKAAPIELKTEEKPPEKVENPYFETEEYVQEGTLFPAPDFNANADCQKLRTAMKGLGTDEAAIIDIMGRRSFKQRMEIVQSFKTVLGRDLVADFISELSGNFLNICKALCIGPDEYDASELRAAMKGLGTDEDALIEIICTRTNAQIKAFKLKYNQIYPNRDLEKDIISETSSNFKRLLVSLLQASRDESQTFDRNLAIQDAKELFEAGEKKFGTDESKFHQIILNRSNPHLRAVFEEYEKLSKMTLEQAIKSEMSGDLMNGLITFVRCIQNKPRYFALALHKTMKGLGTDDRTLLRIVITRCEIDMVQIKKAFQAEYSQRLGQWIKDDTSGDYLKMLLWLTGENDLIK